MKRLARTLVAAMPLLAQQPQPPVIRTTTEEVLLDVVVRDKRGQHEVRAIVRQAASAAQERAFFTIQP